MYHSPPPMQKTPRDRAHRLGWVTHGILCGMPSALATVFWLLQSLEYNVLLVMNGIMVAGTLISAAYWLVVWSRSFPWYMGIGIIGGVWGTGFGVITVLFRFSSMPDLQYVQPGPAETYTVSWDIVIGAGVIGILMACAHAQLIGHQRSMERAILLLMTIGHTITWVGLYAYVLEVL